MSCHVFVSFPCLGFFLPWLFSVSSSLIYVHSPVPKFEMSTQCGCSPIVFSQGQILPKLSMRKKGCWSCPVRIIFASQTASTHSISFFEIPEFLVATVIIIAFLNFEHYCSGDSCKIWRRV